ncbi:MAG: hypothetical protein Alpg2KO_02790 [Alphaproteobacteria bacterium]
MPDFMFNNDRHSTVAHSKKDRGATLLSYGLLVGLIAVIGLAAIQQIGTSAKDLMTNVGDTMNDTTSANQQAPTASTTPATTVTASFWRVEMRAPYTPNGTACTVLTELYLLDPSNSPVTLTGQIVDQGGGDFINDNPDGESSGSCSGQPCSTTASGLCSAVFGPDSAPFDGATPVYASSANNNDMFSRNLLDFSFETTSPFEASGIGITGQQVSIGSGGMTNIPPEIALYHGDSLTGPWTQVGSHSIYSPANEGQAFSGGIQTAVSGLPTWPLINAGPGIYLFNELN